MLAVLCAHRVVTQEQLGRLFPEVPERTLRYRTRRLHDLGLAGRSRPYIERGSAPNHHWPTRHADCLMRGDPAPRGGERQRPSPIFLAHAAALTDLYVTLATGAETVGLSLEGYWREREAREAFEHSGQARAVAPDARVLLVDGEGRELLAFVEVDLGTMSHARLRQKAELYAAYTDAAAWKGRHRFLPALLFLTTSDIRARRFLKTLEGTLSYRRRGRGRRAFVAAAGGVAFTPGWLLDGRCLADLDGDTGLVLLDALNRARAPYEQAVAYRRERREAEEEQRRVLCENPEAMREHLRNKRHALAGYTAALGSLGERTIALLLASSARLSPDERGVLRVIARDLDEALLEPDVHRLPQPGAAVAGEVVLLTDHYRAIQRQEIKTLAGRCGSLPSLRLAWGLLQGGGLLDPDALARLPEDAERGLLGRREQHERRAGYLDSREHAARQIVKRTGPLGRLTHRPGDFYLQIDRERLRVCARCRETVYPQARQARSYGSGSYDAPPACHYCGSGHGTEPYSETPSPSTESEAHQ